MITCLDIGGTSIKGAVAHSASDLATLGSARTPTSDFDRFAGAIAAMLKTSPASAASVVTISITGAIDPESGRIKCANIPCINGRMLAHDLSERLRRPVVVANDADCFALAEARMGAGRGHRIVFGAILGTGVGGGLVVDGKIVTGPGGYAGEWGHGPIAPRLIGDPPVELPQVACGCGLVGCLDTLGAARGIERLHLHLCGTRLESVDIVGGWEAGNAEAGKTVDTYMQIVAPVLALTVNITGAAIVPVGGGMARSRPLIARLDAEVRRRTLRGGATSVVVPAEISGEPGLVGAALLGGMT